MNNVNKEFKSIIPYSDDNKCIVNSNSEIKPTLAQNIISNNSKESLKKKRIESNTSLICKKQKSEKIFNNVYPKVTLKSFNDRSTYNHNNREGINTSVNGKSIEFEYKDSQQEAYATKTCINGDILNFTNKDGVPDGIAKLTITKVNNSKTAYQNSKLEYERRTSSVCNSFIDFTFIDGIPQGKASKLCYNLHNIKFTLIDGIAQGEATETTSSGDSIKFTFVDGIAQGEAILTRRNKSVIMFSYEDGIAQGKATETTIKGNVTEFMFKDGEPEGEVIDTNVNSLFILGDDKREVEPINLQALMAMFPKKLVCL